MTVRNRISWIMADERFFIGFAVACGMCFALLLALRLIGGV